MTPQELLHSLIQEAEDNGYFLQIARDMVTAYIDLRAMQPYLGLTLMPRQPRTENKYTETDLQYMSVIADDSDRYARSTKKKRAQGASLEVSFGHYDIAVDIKAQEIDKIKMYFDLENREAAMNYFLGLMRKLLRYAVDDKHELWAMTALLDAKIKLVGADERKFTLSMTDPTGHRKNVNGAWSDDAYNPITEDILPMIDFLTGKGKTIRFMSCRTTTARILQSNEQVNRLITPNINIQPNLQASLQTLSLYLTQQRPEENIPPILTYDRTYNTQTKTEYFMPTSDFLIVCNSDRQAEIQQGLEEPLFMDKVLGYVGIGTPESQFMPGDVLNVQLHDKMKPTYIEAEQYGCGAPVLQEYEAIGCLKGIS